MENFELETQVKTIARREYYTSDMKTGDGLLRAKGLSGRGSRELREWKTGMN